MELHEEGLLLVIITTFLLSSSGAAIVPVDYYYQASVGDDVQLTWSYDDENQMYNVDWTFKSDTARTLENIMTHMSGVPAIALNGYNVVHGGNGNITLKNVTTESSGIYCCAVSYKLGSGLMPVTGTATLTVYASSKDDLWKPVLCSVGGVVLVVILCFSVKNWEKICKFISELFNCWTDDYPSDPSFPNPQQRGVGGTIHGNPGDANREERGTEVTPETPPSQTAEKANTTPPKVQESYLSRPESSDPKSKQGRSGLDQSEKKTQRNDPPQDEHRENRRDRRSRFQPRRLPNIMRNMWRSLSQDVCKSASNNTVNDRNDPDKETGL